MKETHAKALAFAREDLMQGFAPDRRIAVALGVDDLNGLLVEICGPVPPTRLSA